MNPVIRYQPLRGNSGFYYVRNNARTRAAMKDAVLKTDQLFASRSHQQTLLELLSEHISYHGLRVKVFDGHDTNYFPTGGQFHLKKGFMKSLINGELNDVYLFHMNWTHDKKEKLAFLKQMGEWFVNDKCYGHPLGRTLDAYRSDPNTTGANNSSRSIADTCCSKEPLFSCHYRDLPSIKPCNNSRAFWNRSSWW